MSTSTAIKYMNEMIAAREPHYGREEAVRITGSAVGLGYWSAYRIARGAIKTISSECVDRIRAGYLDFCRSEIAKFQNNIREAGDDVRFADLVAKADLLVAEIREAQGRTGRGR